MPVLPVLPVLSVVEGSVVEGSVVEGPNGAASKPGEKSELEGLLVDNARRGSTLQPDLLTPYISIV